MPQVQRIVCASGVVFDVVRCTHCIVRVPSILSDAIRCTRHFLRKPIWLRKAKRTRNVIPKSFVLPRTEEKPMG